MNLDTKIFSSKQIKIADDFTIRNEAIKSIDLMERAATVCSDWIKLKFSKTKSIKIVCGLGNNGGDGLAIARMLIGSGYTVNVFIVRYSDSISEDFGINEERLRKMYSKNVFDVLFVEQIPYINEDDIVIDALFGIGLSKPLSGISADVIKAINHSKAFVISIDIASGLFADKHSEVDSVIVKPQYTLSFQFPKIAFMFAENDPYVGEFIILDIGLSPSFIEKEPSIHFVLSDPFVKDLLKPRHKFSHKGTFGHSLLIAGSYGKMGAAILAAKACLRSGAGLLTMHVPKCGYEIIQTAVPEAMVSIDANENYFSSELGLSTFSSVGIGPGIGINELTQTAFKNILRTVQKPVVLDADALNILGSDKSLLDLITKDSILTPHPKEFERLVGKASSDFERHEQQLEFSRKYQVYVVLKGAHTCITNPEGISFFNSTGNSGLAKGGSGDVLTGLMTGLLAQGYSSLHASIIAVYIHGLAGDLASSVKGEIGMIPTDVIEAIPDAFNKLQQ